MKRANRITRYMVAFLLGALAISVLILANQVEAETDRQLAEIDMFIETHKTKAAETETVATSYEQYRAEARTAKNDVKWTKIEVSESESVTEEESNVPGNSTDLVADRDDCYSDYGEPAAEDVTGWTQEDFRIAGVIDWNGWRFTWYSEQVLPGGGLDIPGRWSDGNFVRDCDGFLCVASNELPYGSEVETPFGWARVYDAIGDGITGIIDIYVSW